MSVSQRAGCDRCPMRINRRAFLATAGASALLLKMGVLDFAASLSAAPPKPARKPFILRSDNGSNRGVATQVLWRVGQEVTVMVFDGPGTMILGTGRVVSNIDTTFWGGCRTSVELEMDNVADSRDAKGIIQPQRGCVITHQATSQQKRVKGRPGVSRPPPPRCRNGVKFPYLPA